MAKKVKKGKKGKASKDLAKPEIFTTKQQEQERATLKQTGAPLGCSYSVKRRADAIRAEVADARVKTCMLKKAEALQLRGLGLENVPAEISWGVPPFEKMWLSLTELDLSENSLYKTTELFETIACLGPHLKRLDISGNSLAGIIPDCGQELCMLESLKASRNQLEGMSENAAAGWTKLKTLTINRNALTSLPSSAGCWTNLLILDVRFNQLTQLEESCGTWDKLTTAQLGSNKLTHLPDSIGQWTSLKGLYITDNKIGELPPQLAACKNLEVLHAGVNLIKELSPELFGSGCFPVLRELELYRNKIAECPEELGSDMPLLEQVSLSGNALRTIPVGLGQCTALKELHFANVAKLGKVPEDLAGCGKLVYFNVAGCPTVKSLPNCLATSWPELREVDVRSGGKKEKCKLSIDWIEAAKQAGFMLRGGIPPKKKGKGKKK